MNKGNREDNNSKIEETMMSPMPGGTEGALDVAGAWQKLAPQGKGLSREAGATEQRPGILLRQE